MVIYVASELDAEDIDQFKEFLKILQSNDTENTYISPTMTFSHLQDFESIEELKIDLLSICDKLIVYGKYAVEVEFAKMFKMEIEYV